MQKLDRLMIKYILFIALLILLVFNYEQAFTILERFMTILSPIIVGVIMAYILNILMVKFERIWFPRNHNKWVKGSRRPLSILFAILTITIVLVIILGLVIPQLRVGLPLMKKDFQKWALFSISLKSIGGR